VGKDSENVYDDAFWEGLSGVCTALDNVEARMYVDQRCVYYQRPMVDSGTLGTKGNTQVIVPFLTESYGSSRDPPEDSIPICTLKNFPNKIEHTIQYARDLFEGYFKQAPEETNSYLGRVTYLEELAKNPTAELTTLETIKSCLVDDKPLGFDQCIQWARKQFQIEFHDKISQLLEVFPAGSTDSHGNQFWSGPKRAPTPVVFDATDPVHVEFVTAAANLRAFNFGLKGFGDQAGLLKVAVETAITPFVKGKAKKIAATDEEAKQMAEKVEDDHDTKTKAAIASLPSPSSMAGYRLHPADFEKDDDSNFHIAFITACSNLRARNYNITEVNAHETKFIAGKIIPAIATTTALVTGLVCLEMYKLVQKKGLDQYRNSFVNLALPLFALSEPIPPATNKAPLKSGEWAWSLWDRIEIDIGDATLQELIDHFEEKYGLEINMLSFGASMLYYNFVMNKKNVKERLKKPITEVIAEVTKAALAPGIKYIILEACVNTTDEEELDVDIPCLRVKVR
jgi:ubiquitin-activating enzyme E1